MVAQTRHKDPYRRFFTVDEALGGYMASLLELEAGDALLEPAAGDGHLIDAAKSISSHVQITAYELHPEHAENLRRKYSGDETIRIFERDTIFCRDLDLKENFGPKYSKILANPPYGAWQEYERRAELKRRFPGFYVRETYTLFLLRCLRVLRDGGRLVFIIPDTFLYLHLHAPIRKFMLENYTVENIDVFNSSLFPGINFGYAGLCIVSLKAERAQASHSFKVRLVETLNGFHLNDHIDSQTRIVTQAEVLRSHGYAIPLSNTRSGLNEISDRVVTIADVADCVTGFYSGQDKTFLRRSSDLVKRSDGYEIVDWSLVESRPFSLPCLLDGIAGDRCFVPILKGGGYNFIKPQMWFVDWSAKSVSHYKSDPKSRFQNSSYYFRRGIGFPMVTSTRPTAALIEDCLFDQSIVGIFPKGCLSLEFILAYCNSQPFWNALKSVNPSANNSSKYVLRTPIVLPNEHEHSSITSKTKDLLELLRKSDPSSRYLQEEILKSIAQYADKATTDRILETKAL